MQSQTKEILLSFVFILIMINTNSAFTQSEITTKPSNNIQQNYSLSLMLRLNNSFEQGSPSFTDRLPDTVAAQKPKAKLLPERLSIVERALWGESGFLRFTGIAPLTPSSRKNELTYRRTVLSIHQIAGFTTMALFIPTLIYGQRNINMRNAAAEGRGVFDQNLTDTHKRIAQITFGAYMTTAALAIFAPPPIIRRNEWSSISTHKTLALIHFTGMIATPILAILAYHAKTLQEERNLQKAHQITAYVTAAAFAASMVVITF